MVDGMRLMAAWTAAGVVTCCLLRWHATAQGGTKGNWGLAALSALDLA